MSDQMPGAGQNETGRDAAGQSPSGGSAPKPPSLVPGTILLGLAGVLIVVVLVKPDMPPWLRTAIAVVAVLVVIALLVVAFRAFRSTTRRPR